MLASPLMTLSRVCFRWWWCGLVLLCACGGAPNAASSAVAAAPQAGSRQLRPVAVFPARSKLDALASEATPARESEAVASVDQWLLSGRPVAGEEQPEPTAAMQPWRQALERACGASPLRPSRALDCVAEQAGRFLLAKRGLPDVSLRRFMAARCDAYAPNIELSSSVAKVSASAPDERLAEEFAEHLAKSIAGRGKRIKPSERIGLWVARERDKLTVLVARAHVEADIAPVVVGPEGGVVLSGLLTTERLPRQLHALINQGTRQVQACKSLELKPPRFSVSCQMAPDDSEAWIELVAYPEQRLLGHTLARVLAHREPLDQAYVARHYVDKSADAKSAAAFTAQALASLQQIRQQAGLAPFTTSHEQSAANTSLSAQLIDAFGREDGSVADQIALGLLAGWDVEGVIRDGAVLSAGLRGVHSPDAWLDETLESPFGRNVLLDPKSTVVAMGAVFDRPWAGVSVVLTTFQLFDEEELGSRAERLFEAIGAQRKARGLSPPRRLASQELDLQAHLIRTRGKHPEDALDTAMHAISATVRLPLRGGYAMTRGLELDELPAEFAQAAPLTLALAVTHLKVEGSAWGQYVVLFVILDTAARAPSKRTI